VHGVLLLNVACFLSLVRAWDESGRTRMGIGKPMKRFRSCVPAYKSGINRFLMKRLLVFFIMSAAFGHGLFASDSLPFPVSLGGQAAKDGTPFAKIENPVAADAELAVESKSDMIIVNVHMVNAKNEPIQGSTPAVILLQGKLKRWMERSWLPEITS
jgi:hypothetical protein